MAKMTLEQFTAKVRAKLGRPCKRGAPELFAVAFAIFRAHFHEEDPLELVCEKWAEWEEDRAKCIRFAHAAIRAVDESRNDTPPPRGL